MHVSRCDCCSARSHTASTIRVPKPLLSPSSFADAAVDEEALLGSSGGYLSGFGYDKAARRDKSRGGDKFGALEDEGANTTAADRYRYKHSKYYSKYGLR
jgi:hypothetical protein